MTSGRIQKWGGKLLKVDGKIATHEDCCCGASDDPCEYCTTTPLVYEVTLSGLGGAYAADLNGETEELEQIGGASPCTWNVLVDHPVSGNYEYRLEIWDDGDYTLTVDYNDPPDPADPIFDADGEIAPESDCWGGLETPINNTLGAGGQAAVARGTP